MLICWFYGSFFFSWTFFSFAWVNNIALLQKEVLNCAQYCPFEPKGNAVVSEAFVCCALKGSFAWANVAE